MNDRFLTRIMDTFGPIFGPQCDFHHPGIYKNLRRYQNKKEILAHINNHLTVSLPVHSTILTSKALISLYKEMILETESSTINSEITGK